MGRAYAENQKSAVRELLEQGRDEETIEKATGVSDRTIRRWRQELEKTGRIGKVRYCGEEELQNESKIVADGLRSLQRAEPGDTVS